MKEKQFTTQELEQMLQERKEKEAKELQKKELDLKQDKEDFLAETCVAFAEISERLKQLKKNTISNANVLHNRMFEIQGKERKTQKTFTLKSDYYKVVIEKQERFEFTEEATVHIEAIKEIFKNKFEGRNKGFYSFLESILMKNSKGEFDPKLLAKGRREVEALGDPNLIEEYTKLEKCQRVYGSAIYCRAYHKDGANRWQDINIQFSSM